MTSTENPKWYKYQPLPPGHIISLLKLHANDPTSARLALVNILSRPLASGPDYEAISYVWDKPPVCVTISITIASSGSTTAVCINHLAPHPPDPACRAAEERGAGQVGAGRRLLLHFGLGWRRRRYDAGSGFNNGGGRGRSSRKS
ncbi:hypothetical protein BFW01_g975 [Lasiodiplodia theobromae]|uniref:Uncharacterized protein n=1 Tax=Lasiodiplodia theobromae TaxID=45133 RepID=A0A8H7MBB5_9PEZI|nr:Ankyrin and HET domain protein [Lasiodiplodia theobromae]KAF4546274.1 Ankyrin and HET domain protein [Lasiodiplodia theobromae]KAF9630413.1 hypothetical protein BFW01_g975 [Lasiodiplodia theobromae]